MPQHIDNSFLIYAALEVLLIVVPIFGYKVFLITKITRKKNDVSFIFNPLSWYTLFLKTPNNGSFFTAQLIIIMFTVGIFVPLLTETYYENAVNALSKSKNTAIGTVSSNVKHPYGHGRCIITYQYEITDDNNIAHQYTQEWSGSACQLKPNTQITVRYVNTHPLISSIGYTIEAQVTRERGKIKRIYLIVSAIIIVILVAINRGKDRMIFRLRFS